MRHAFFVAKIVQLPCLICFTHFLAQFVDILLGPLEPVRGIEFKIPAVQEQNKSTDDGGGHCEVCQIKAAAHHPAEKQQDTDIWAPRIVEWCKTIGVPLLCLGRGIVSRQCLNVSQAKAATVTGCHRNASFHHSTAKAISHQRSHGAPEHPYS